MAEADRPSVPRKNGLGTTRGGVVLVTLAISALAETACTPKLPPPQTPPNKSVPSEPSGASPKSAAESPDGFSAEQAPSPGSARDATLIVIDPGDSGDGSRPSLVEASRREKERKAQAGKPVAVITNETLPKLAKKGQITFADLSKTKPGETPPANDVASAEHEQSWRGRGLAIRQRWRAALDETADLERQAADLRRRFYAEADPFRRDGEIKPNWDRTLDRIRLAQERAEAAQKELEVFLEEGRRAGALPGWLREGAELEPEAPAPLKTTVEAIEPPTLQPKDER